MEVPVDIKLQMGLKSLEEEEDRPPANMAFLIVFQFSDSLLDIKCMFWMDLYQET